MGQHGKGISESNQISGIGCFIAHPTEQALQIVNGIQILPDFIPAHCLTEQRFDPVETVFYLLPLD